MSTRTKRLTAAGSAPDEVKTLELSLPIPSDRERRVEALDFLNRAVEQYIEDYGDDVYGDDDESSIKPDIHFPGKKTRRANADDDDFIPDRPEGRAITVPQAIQLCLCAVLIFFLW